VRDVRVCETCKHKATPPQGLLDLYREISRLFPKVYYCSKLQVIKAYDPSSPAKLFDCDLYEESEA
jgi:hypothetical protein